MPIFDFDISDSIIKIIGERKYADMVKMNERNGIYEPAKWPKQIDVTREKTLENAASEFTSEFDLFWHWLNFEISGTDCNNIIRQWFEIKQAKGLAIKQLIWNKLVEREVENDPILFLTSGPIWDSLPQGSYYWEDLDEKWRKYFRSYQEAPF